MVDNIREILSKTPTSSQRYNINAETGIIEVIDVTSQNPDVNIPILFAPGMGATINTNLIALNTMAGKGRRVVSLNHPRRGGKIPGEIQAEELRKARSLLAVINETGAGKVDVIAHSEGAINTILAALINPDKFRNIVLVEPAGLVGRHSIATLIERQGRENDLADQRQSKNKDFSDQAKTIDREFGKYLASNPLRALNEIHAISRAEIQEMLRVLHEKGIKIAIFQSADSRLFPMDLVQKMVKDSKIDGFYSLQGGHYDIQHDPRFAIQTVKALEALEMKVETDTSRIA